MSEHDEHLWIGDLRKHPTGEVRLYVNGKLRSGTVARGVTNSIDEVHAALRDMEIERNMLRITVEGLTETLARVEALADEWESNHVSLRGLSFRDLEHGPDFAADLRAALADPDTQTAEADR